MVRDIREVAVTCPNRCRGSMVRINRAALDDSICPTCGAARVLVQNVPPRGSARRPPATAGLSADAGWQRRKAEHAAARRDRARSFQDQIGAYLHAAHLDATVSGHGVVKPGTDPFAFGASDRRRADPRAFIDRLVANRFRRELLTRVADELSDRGLKLTARLAADGVRLHDGNRSIAMIKGTAATLEGRSDVIAGNFLADGEHWDVLRTWLWQSQVADVLTELPDEMTDEERAQALADSEQLRHDRTLEFGHPVKLQLPERAIRFDPIDANERRVELPFEYHHDDAYLRGALRLSTPRDPLALVVQDRSADARVVAAGWGLALRGYVELTCVPTDENPTPNVARDPESRTAPAGVSSRSSTRADPKPHTVPGRRDWGRTNALRPDATTRLLIASYVVGHRRRLAAGRQPSEEARQHAQRIGVALGPRETWVKPHARGIPADTELVFNWRVG